MLLKVSNCPFGFSLVHHARKISRLRTLLKGSGFWHRATFCLYVFVFWKGVRGDLAVNDGIIWQPVKRLQRLITPLATGLHWKQLAMLLHLLFLSLTLCLLIHTLLMFRLYTSYTFIKLKWSFLWNHLCFINS